MKNWSNKIVQNEILLASASIIFGLVIGPVLEKILDPLFSTEIRASLVSILVLGLLIIIGMVGTGIFARHNEEQRKSIAEDIRGIQKKISLSATFFYDLPRQEGTGELFRSIFDLVEQAEKSIWVIGYQRPTAPEESEKIQKNEAWRNERDRYYDLIIRKCNEHKRKTLFYRRIWQLQNAHNIQDGVVISEMLGPTQTKHAIELLEFMRQYPDAAVLKYADRRD